MAYDLAELEKMAVAAIEENELVFVSEVVSFLPCARSTFDGHEMGKSVAVKDALISNRVKKKIKLRSRLENSESAAAMIAAYKLLGTKAETDKLNGSKQEVKHTGELNISAFNVIPPNRQEEE